MRQRRLLFLFCLAIGLLFLAQLTHADGDLRVNEPRTRFVLHTDSIEVQLAVENTTGETRQASVRLELLDTKGNVLSETFETQSVAPGNRILRFKMPQVIADLTKFERRELLWYRLRYRFVEVVKPSMSVKSGIISLSEIMPDLFEIRVATSEMLREGGRYSARVQAVHPFTQQPAAGVQLNGEITFEDDDDVKAKASATTNKEGYATLDFALPKNLAKSSSGDLRVVGTRDGVVAEAEGEVTVDSLARTLITTDKGLYQPGQTMHIRALVFGPTKRALVNQNITIKIADPEGVNVFVATGRTSRFGVVNTDWQIPDNVRLGDYRVWVDREGTERQAALDVRVSRYELPNFSVSVEPDRGYYLPGQNAKVKVRADYLFGQRVKRGHVRVVRESGRDWNFREQKWEIDEGDEYEGETDAQGTFEATVDLESEHEDLADSDYNQFKDLTYSAYFTDPTTNRTEQRRFSLRVTKEAIHVYLINRNYDSYQDGNLPLQFYVSTFYADGSPARCKVEVSLTPYEKAPVREQGTASELKRTIRTNRYGLAKTSIRIGDDLAERYSLNLKLRATDSNGRSGSAKERFYLNDDAIVFVETEKSLYNVGEPIVASITSNLPDREMVVELAKDSSVIRSERVRVRGGKATVTFPYTPNLTGRITIAAYPDFADSHRMIGLRTVLYPGNPELNLNVRTSQATYRPGDDASVRLRVRTADGQAAESALGVVVSDKAVEERMRTDSEFGGSYQPYNQTVNEFLGLSEELAGVTFRDLRRLDMTKVVPPDLDLLAEILLNQSRQYYPEFYRDEEYETDLAKVFGPTINPQVKHIYDALYTHYLRQAQYPGNESTLRQYLREAGIDLQQIVDPWGVNYRAEFSIEGRVDVFTLTSAGADKRFDTADDFSVLRMNWDYFIPTGNKIQSAVDRYHLRNKGFIRDLETLRQELARDGFSLDQLRDRWGQPYHFAFVVNETNYVIEITSAGPDRRFSEDPDSYEDDFRIWTAQIDYFADPRRLIEKTLSDKLQSTKKFPQSELELRETLRDSPHPFETLRDPWNRSYYPVFKTESVYADRVEMENRASLGNPATMQTRMLPVTRTIASITLKSPGEDGQEGTVDDFAVATFSRVIKEESRGNTPVQPVDLVLSSANGAIYGVVTDPAGAVIPDARITATQTPDIHRFYVSSDENGAYVLKDLPPGMYEVRIDRPGFATSVVTDVQVRVSSLTQINVVMQPGAVTEAVTVMGGSEPLNSTTAQVSRSIQARSVIDLPGLAKSTATAAQISTPRLREYFPETLVWQPSIETDPSGRANIKFKLADNITTWKMAVIGSTEDGRIGTAETEFKAFQPFFVEHDPPRILTEGDEISLPVVVRNYLDRLQKVDLEIKPQNWFSLLGPARKQTSVAAGDAKRQTFDLRVVSSGEDRPQRITALGSNANDAIEKPVTVHPDGEDLSITAGDILAKSAALEVNVPENAIPNSTRAELKIYPNLMAHVVESVEGIMRRPYGCGEQTISSTYPSLLLLRNAKQTGEEFALRGQAQRYLNIGYTRLLSYRDENGGFAYWSDGSPDVALTAYALRFLADAADVMEVDREVIRKAREWLIKQQDTDGSWGPHQFVADQSQLRQRAVLTAYVARVLAATEAKMFSESLGNASEQERAAFAASLNRAVDYVSQRSSEIDEPYLLASYALALIELRDAARAKPVVEKLRSLARTEGVGSYWSLEANTPFYGWGLAGRIETTALAVQTLSRYCGMQEGSCAENSELIKRGLLFLFKNKDGYGVWYSTQATINVLDTMLTIFTTNKSERDANSTAQIEINGRVVRTVTIPETRRLANPIIIPITSFLSTGKNRIELKRPGGGAFSSVQVTANYYAPWREQPSEQSGERSPYSGSSELRFSTSFNKTEGEIGEAITCYVEAERVGFRGYGMLLAEVGLPPGADVDRSSLDKARKDWGISQYDVLPDRIVFYLWPRAGGLRFDFQFRARFGLAAKTAPSVIYDYYNPESRLVVPPVKFKVK